MATVALDVTVVGDEDGLVADARRVFSLRLGDQRLRELVREVADREHLSQNELIEQAVEHEVIARGAMLAEDLAAAADRLARLTAEQSARLVTRSIESFGAGESRPEPVQARALGRGGSSRSRSAAALVSAAPADADVLGVLAVFDDARAVA